MPLAPAHYSMYFMCLVHYIRASPIINLSPQGGIFVTIDEAASTYHNHSLLQGSFLVLHSMGLTGV